MPDHRQNFDDTGCLLTCIKARHSTHKITTQLVDIQSSRVPQKKPLKFIANLQTLYFPKLRKERPSEKSSLTQLRPVLERRTIDAFNQRRYIALSYTWRPCPKEAHSPAGTYLVQGRGIGQFAPSPVRDIVFRRIRKYMKYVSVHDLWIDQHCIDQEEGREKEIGMQAMDRVYSLSKFPAALLSQLITSPDQLQLLVEILSGRFVHQNLNGYWVSRKTSLQEALRGIELMNYITSDEWFNRGWTFQENYRAGERMVLLIPHPRRLNKIKPYKLMGSLDRQLCIKSVRFSEELTKLCLAYKSHQPPPRYLDDVLAKAGKYTVLLQAGNAKDQNSAPMSMSPTIIADLAKRELEVKWDRLPIVANCCQYSERLDSTKLRAEGHSLSLSILTLCLINGEVLSNHPGLNPRVSTTKASSIAEALKMHSFDGLESPSAKKKLLYNKSCRFSRVKLTEEGIETAGHIWRLHKVLRTESFLRGSDRRYEESSGPCLNNHELWLIRQLVNELSRRGNVTLSEQLHRLTTIEYPKTFARDWQVRMARAVAAAIERREMLCIARMVHGPHQGVGIFIMASGDRGIAESGGEHIKASGTFTSVNGKSCGKLTNQHLQRHPRYIFTSFWPAEGGSGKFDLNDVERHISMEVDSPDLKGSYRGRPRLFTKSWIHGLCFFYECPEHDVVFPWPASLQDL